mmetsp:Transcript_38193/g.113182  ORF Transcript_38193/g.113182 Transcript_38193/m.113182 type:complete len:205 (-) Transcript_38193:559-1173(-)
MEPYDSRNASSIGFSTMPSWSCMYCMMYSVRRPTLSEYVFSSCLAYPSSFLSDTQRSNGSPDTLNDRTVSPLLPSVTHTAWSRPAVASRSSLFHTACVMRRVCLPTYGVLRRSRMLYISRFPLPVPIARYAPLLDHAIAVNSCVLNSDSIFVTSLSLGDHMSTKVLPDGMMASWSDAASHTSAAQLGADGSCVGISGCGSDTSS